jgi:hypothetical protein
MGEKMVYEDIIGMGDVAFSYDFGVGDKFRADRRSKRAIISSSNKY